MKTYIAALTVLVIALCAVAAGIVYSYKTGHEHGVSSVDRVIVEMEIIKEGCYVPSIKWEGEA